jgi:hypothetical protein
MKARCELRVGVEIQPLPNCAEAAAQSQSAAIIRKLEAAAPATAGIRPSRRGGRVAEGGGLLNRYTVKSCIGGSNPPLSASHFKLN